MAKTYSDEVKAISQERGVDLGVAQAMYNSGTKAGDGTGTGTNVTKQTTNTTNTGTTVGGSGTSGTGASQKTKVIRNNNGATTVETTTTDKSGTTNTASRTYNDTSNSTNNTNNASGGYYNNGTYNSGTYSGNVVTGTGGSYSIGSETGKNLLNTLTTGGTLNRNSSAYTVNSDGSVTTKDGATWKSNGNGTVTVTDASGNKTTFGTAASASTTPATTTASGTYTFNTYNGDKIYNAVASGSGSRTITNDDGSTAEVYQGEDGVVYVKNNSTGEIARAENIWNQADHSDTTSDVAKAIASGNVYVWEVGDDGKAPSDAKVGDYVLTGGGLYRIGENGGEIVDAAVTTGNYDGRWGDLLQSGADTSKTASVKDVSGNDYNLTTDRDGNVLSITRADGSAIEGGLLKLKSGNTTTAYIASPLAEDGTQTYHVATNAGVDMLDMSTGQSVTFTDASGHVVKAGELYLCDDNVIRSAANGREIQDLSTDVSDAANYVVEINGQYYSVLNGQNVTDQVDPTLWQKEWTEDKQTMIDALLSTLRDQGYINAPQRSDYTDKELTWDQALAQASNQLGASYDAAMNNTLDSMNRQALETGFYGQLPTEALRQQAAASAEVDKQAAIYDLANDLVNNSREYAEQLFEDDTATNEDRLNVLTKIVDYLYEDYANDISQANSQQAADQITAEHQQAMLSYAIAAMEAGIPVSTLNEYLGKISA